MFTPHYAPTAQVHFLPVGHLCIHLFIGCICCYAQAAVCSTHKTACIQRTSTKEVHEGCLSEAVFDKPSHIVHNSLCCLFCTGSIATAAKQRKCCQATHLLPSNATATKQCNCCQATESAVKRLLPSNTSAAVHVVLALTHVWVQGRQGSGVLT